VIVLASKYYSAMRKIYFLLIPLLMWGCEKTYDGLIDSKTDNYQVSSIAGIKDTVDLKNPPDSLLNLRLLFTQSSQVFKAYFDIYSSDNSRLNTEPVEMDEILENVFENQFILKREYPIGNYTIRFSAEGFDGKLKQVALTTFYFLNGQDNLPPVISNSVIEPDTVIVNDTTVIFTSIEAMDPNGKSDLLEVYFKVYKPDGSTNNFKWLLLDDGSCCPLPPFNQVSGDVTANDGIYSRKIEVNQGNDKGTYRFEFQARDRSGEISNIINHFVLIQ
jgi:hypothetical protein